MVYKKQPTDCVLHSKVISIKLRKKSSIKPSSSPSQPTRIYIVALQLTATAAMKLSIASAILCTVLLASFCNAYPYPNYWDDEAFLDQLQQERMGTDVEARIEQVDIGGTCTKCSAETHSLFISIVHNIIAS